MGRLTSYRWRIVQYILLIAAAAVMIFPFLWTIVTSLKPEGEIVRYPPGFLPEVWTFTNYIEIWVQLPFFTFLKNSVIFSIGVTFCTLLFDSMAAYAFARLQFRGRNPLFILVLCALMIPIQITMIPLFIMVNSLGWIDTYAGLIVPRLTNAFGIFMLRQFFVGLPRELDDAARVDGCNEFRLYWQIILPQAKSAMIALGIFNLMHSWNDLLWPLVITSTESMRTLTAGLTLLVGQHVVEYGLLTSSSILVLAPLIIAFLFAQKYFIQGITFTGIKG